MNTLYFIVVLVSSTLALAQAPVAPTANVPKSGAVPEANSEALKVAKELVISNGYAQVLLEGIDKAIPYLRQSTPKGTKVNGVDITTDEFWKRFQKNQAGEIAKLKESVIAYVTQRIAKKMSVAEMRECIRFFNSPAGKKAAELSFGEGGGNFVKSRVFEGFQRMVAIEAKSSPTK